MMSILRALRGYLAGCPCLGALTGGIKTDWTDEAGDYALMPSGQVELARYMDGTRLMRYQCFLTARRFTQADLERVENAEFFEDFSRWIAERDAAGDYPDLGPDSTTESIACGEGALNSFDETGSEGSYRIGLTLEYERGG